MKRENEGGLRDFSLALHVSRIANMQYFEMPANFKTHPGSHPFRELIYVDSGEIAVQSPDYTGPLRAHELLIHRTGERHSLACGEIPPNLIILGLECDCPRLDAFSYTPTTPSAAEERLLVEIVKEGRNVFLPPYDLPNTTEMQTREEFPFGADQLIRNLLECFLIKLIREGDAPHAEGQTHSTEELRIGEVLRYLENNRLQRITLQELCFLFGTNKTTLTKEFRRVSGGTVMEYLATLRLRDAKQLLREGKRNVTEIAELLNFSSVHYFTRFFRKHENMSPTEYASSIRARFEE